MHIRRWLALRLLLHVKVNVDILTSVCKLNSGFLASLKQMVRWSNAPFASELDAEEREDYAIIIFAAVRSGAHEDKQSVLLIFQSWGH